MPGEVTDADPALPEVVRLVASDALVPADLLEALRHGFSVDPDCIDKAMQLHKEQDNFLAQTQELRERHTAPLLEYPQRVQDAAFPNAPNAARWPNHDTKKLEALRLAAHKFWGRNYDPAQPDTAPKNDTVIEWLQKEHGIGATPAAEMASILRPESLRTGPR